MELDEALRAVDLVRKIAHGARRNRRNPRLNPVAVATYDKGYDDALDHVRAALKAMTGVAR